MRYFAVSCRRFCRSVPLGKTTAGRALPPWLMVCAIVLCWGLSWGMAGPAQAAGAPLLAHASRPLAIAAEDDRTAEGRTLSDLEQIVARGELVVAVLGNDNAPFFMEVAPGEIGGLDIQLAQAIADQLGVELVLNRTAETFDEVVDTVYAGEADLAISKISRTMKRAVRVRFSRPYLQMRQGLLINRLQFAQQGKSNNPTETIRGLSGQVGVIKGSSYVGFLKQKFPQATIVELESWADIVAAVSSGDLLAGYRDELEIKKVVLTKPDAALQLQTAVLTDTRDAIAMVLPWDSPHLLAFADQYLDTLDTAYTVDGLLEEFAAYWQAQQAAL
ncbi:MAG TPA: transporter substrate-binding domain-containing protein [Candidatus Obscuribacterales bacterium]